MLNEILHCTSLGLSPFGRELLLAPGPRKEAAVVTTRIEVDLKNARELGFMKAHASGEAACNFEEQTNVRWGVDKLSIIPGGLQDLDAFLRWRSFKSDFFCPPVSFD